MKSSLRFIRFSLLLFAICLGRQFLHAQGSLQFNQIINYELTSGTPQAFTVPAGKVWKVESAGIVSGSSVVYLRNSSGTPVAVLNLTNSSNYAYINTVFPIWLKENYSGQFYSSGTNAFISIIEFNIIP